MRQLEQKTGQHAPASSKRRLTAWPARAMIFTGAVIACLLILEAVGGTVAIMLCGLTFAAAIVAEVLVTARIRKEDPMRVIGFRIWLADRYLAKPDAPPMNAPTVLGDTVAASFGTLPSGDAYTAIGNEPIADELEDDFGSDAELFHHMPDEDIIEGTADEVGLDD